MYQYVTHPVNHQHTSASHTLSPHSTMYSSHWLTISPSLSNRFTFFTSPSAHVCRISGMVFSCAQKKKQDYKRNAQRGPLNENMLMLHGEAWWQAFNGSGEQTIRVPARQNHRGTNNGGIAWDIINP